MLIGVNPGLAADDPERAARRLGDARWVTLLRERGTAAFADAWNAQPLFATQTRVSARSAVRRRAARRLGHDPEQLARSLEVMGLAEMPDYRGALAAHAPKLSLLAGADDAKYVALGRAAGVRSPPSPIRGHDPTLEQPERLAVAIARAIEQRDECRRGSAAGGPSAAPMNAHSVVARTTGWPSRSSSVARMHDAAFHDAIHVVPRTCWPTVTCAR